MGIDGLPNKAADVFRQRDVRRTTASTLTQSQSQTIVAPIGAVMGWLKSFTNTPQTLPVGFVECNGQVLSDGDSVYDGQTLPDLNGDNQFLRGNSTSGGTGGSETMAHTHSITFEANGVNTGGIATSRAATTGQASNTENRPPFYNMVWIMRIK